MGTLWVEWKSVQIPRTRNPYSAAFWEQIVKLHKAGRNAKDLSREFELCVVRIHTWNRQAERDGGKRADTLSSEERDELRRLRLENKQLLQERDILSKAAAWFAQNDITGPRSLSL